MGVSPPRAPAPSQPQKNSGAIAQLGEHLLCKQGVVGSIPTGSTSFDGMTAHTQFDPHRLAWCVFFDNMDVASVLDD